MDVERRQVRAGSVPGLVGVRFRAAEGLMSPPQDLIVKIRDLVRQWHRRPSVTARCLRAACICAPPPISCSIHSGAPSRTRWTNRSGSWATSWSRFGARAVTWGLACPASPRNFDVHGCLPLWVWRPCEQGGLVREGHVDRGGVSSLHLGLDAYAYPPVPLILAVLNKAASSSIRLCLMHLAGLARPNSSPVGAPNGSPTHAPRMGSPALAPGLIGRVFHETPSFFKLHTWRLSGISSKREAFRKTFSIKCLGLKGSRPLLPTTASGPSS
jgi:hypothetical protein